MSLVMMVLACMTLLPSSSAIDTFNMYMLAIRWPPAACYDAGGRILCATPYPRQFIIHGLWPQFPSGNSVPPYTENPSCTNLKPVLVENLMDHVERSTRQKLSSNWPSLFGHASKDDNENFWKHEWTNHGMCSDWADDPNQYFATGIKLQMSFTSILHELALYGVSRGNHYKVGYISNALRSSYGGNNRAYPEIACNTGLNGYKQLHEIRFCYERKGKKQPSVLVNCRNKYSNQCSSDDDVVSFRAHYDDQRPPSYVWNLTNMY